MNEKAVIDRFEEQGAVLLVGEGSRQLVVPRQSLPPDAAEGQWLRVQVEGEKLLSAVVDGEETDLRRRRISEKRARLLRRSCLQKLRARLRKEGAEDDGKTG